ncbi:MAG: hypothetical protein JXQ65_01740 [Candidatus Marinimicrobia bacterium]|nr:hypothetical protein [Candidatus Neomarinimicrobiota bacterium]
MDDLFCPACGAELDEEMLRQALVCPYCKTKFRNRKYADFLELLVYYDIVEDLDFLDFDVYGEEMMVMNEDDSEEIDLTPDEFDTKNEIWNEFEDDTELNESMEEENVAQESWNIFDDEVAIDDDAYPMDEDVVDLSDNFSHELGGEYPDDLEDEFPEDEGEDDDDYDYDDDDDDDDDDFSYDDDDDY